jgi:transposase
LVVKRERPNQIQVEALSRQGQESDPIIGRITLDDAEREEVLNSTLDILASKAHARDDARTRQEATAQAWERRKS